MIGIYKITNPKNKSYIGKTKNWERRKKDYNGLRCKEQRKLYYSLIKYGIENHKFEIIEECSYNELNEKEIFWIKELKVVENGLNLTYGGDGGNLSKESEELRRINSMKNIYQYDLEGNFIKEWKGASDAIKSIGYGNGNNINDCARGIYQSTYGYRWKYKKDILIPYEKLDPIIKKEKGALWTERRRIKTKNSRIGETRSNEYKIKISEIRKKKIYQFDINNNLICVFPSFNSINGSKIIGQTKLRKIINKPISYNGYYYSYSNKPINIEKHTKKEMKPKFNYVLYIDDVLITQTNKLKNFNNHNLSIYIINKCLNSPTNEYIINKNKINETKYKLLKNKNV